MKRKYDLTYWNNKVEEIMNHFDFTCAYRTMSELEWEWVGHSSCPPNVDDLRAEARRLLDASVKEVMKHGWPFCCGTGGFWVDINPVDGYLSLKFVAAEYDIWDES